MIEFENIAEIGAAKSKERAECRDKGKPVFHGLVNGIYEINIAYLLLLRPGNFHRMARMFRR
jgi:hypothetical protein